MKSNLHFSFYSSGNTRRPLKGNPFGFKTPNSGRAKQPFSIDSQDFRSDDAQDKTLLIILDEAQALMTES
jgi:hypothetical protein